MLFLWPRNSAERDLGTHAFHKSPRLFHKLNALNALEDLDEENVVWFDLNYAVNGFSEYKCVFEMKNWIVRQNDGDLFFYSWMRRKFQVEKKIDFPVIEA